MNRRLRLIAHSGLVLALFTVAAAAVPETQAIDPARSSIGFSLRHFVGRGAGTFTRFSGTVVFDPDDVARCSVEAVIDVASIDTRNRKRDDHLRSADFFDVTRYPHAKFAGRRWTRTGATTFDVTGDLTLKDVTKPIVLKVTWLGAVHGADGVERSRWDATTRFDKREFNVKDPPLLDATLGDEVSIAIHIEARKT